MPRGRSQDALRRRWNRSQSQNRNRRHLWEEPVQEQRRDLYRVMNRAITMNWNPVGLHINTAVDILVMVVYVVLVLGVGLWVRRSPEGTAGRWTQAGFINKDRSNVTGFSCCPGLRYGSERQLLSLPLASR